MTRLDAVIEVLTLTAKLRGTVHPGTGASLVVFALVPSLFQVELQPLEFPTAAP